MLEYARRHKDYSFHLEEALYLQPKVLVEYGATDEARQLARMANEVRYAVKRFQAFTRLAVSPHGILSAEVEPEHFIEDLLVESFVRCFPSFSIALSSPRGTFLAAEGKELVICRKPLSWLVQDLERTRPKNPLLEPFTEITPAFWDTFGCHPLHNAGRSGELETPPVARHDHP